MSRRSTGIFQQQELRERLRRLERELAELKAVTNKQRSATTPITEKPPPSSTSKSSDEDTKS